VCPSERSRGTSSEPTKPLAPVTRMRITTDDDADGQMMTLMTTLMMS